MRGLFLKWALLNGLFILGLGGAKTAYHGHIHNVGIAAIAAVLVVYVLAAGYCGYLAWTEKITNRGHVDLAIDLSPMIAMMGTTAGFLIAFGADAADIQHRVLGASTGLASTFVGIAVAVVLMMNRHLLRSGVNYLEE